MFERKKAPQPQKRIDSLIGAGTTVQGDVVFTGGLRIDGVVSGRVVTVDGIGRYLQNSPPHHSTFEFESDDWKSLITKGRGIWQYEPMRDGTYFKTVYDYGVRYGLAGRLLDYLLFRRLMQLATEWGFETMRLWCGGNQSVLTSRSRRIRFALFFIARLVGKPPAKGAATSWLGTGQESSSLSRSRV